MSVTSSSSRADGDRSKCRYGPQYWCESEENARLCKFDFKMCGRSSGRSSSSSGGGGIVDDVDKDSDPRYIHPPAR